MKATDATDATIARRMQRPKNPTVYTGTCEALVVRGGRAGRCGATATLGGRAKVCRQHSWLLVAQEREAGNNA